MDVDMASTERDQPLQTHQASKSIGEALRLASLALIWFALMSSNYLTSARSLPVLDGVRSLCLALLPLGGIIGSLVFSRVNPSRLDTLKTKTTLGFVLILALVTLNVAALRKASLLELAAYLCSAILITVLFLEECSALAKHSVSFILKTFFLVAILIPAQILLSDIFALSGASLGFSALLELSLAALFIVSLCYRDKPWFIRAVCTDKNPLDALEEGLCANRHPDEIFLNAASPNAGAQNEQGHLPWQLMIHMFLFYFAIMLVWMLAEVAPASRPSIPVGAASGAVALAAFYFSYIENDGHLHYWLRTRQITLPLAISALPVLGVGGPWSSTAALFLIQTAYRFFLLSSYVEVFFICKNTFIDNRRVLAGVHVALYLGMILGIGAWDVFSPHAVFDQRLFFTLCVIVNLCLIVASCWLGDDKSAAKVWGRRIELTPKGRQDILSKRACDLIAQRYGLTPKEAETLAYVVQGYNVEIVAEKLVVSVNTIRTHIRSIYNKLDVHSRAEVCRVFEGVRKELK